MSGRLSARAIESQEQHRVPVLTPCINLLLVFSFKDTEDQAGNWYMTAPYNVYAKRMGEEYQERWSSAVKALVCAEWLSEQRWTDITMSDAQGNQVDLLTMQGQAAAEVASHD